ncbi:hypothetical protein [Neotamlana nanhaiensis]|uniref:hypothetical protein n=1 Tax=Neotamlana nanhaiensis TaxID=1382798 RepID=UPI0012FF0A5C|nr:hypothetical protein [Tamlana nanhaiensis]
MGLSQVGIGTTNPTATLDVDGTLKVRTTIQETNMEVITDSIMVISRNGYVNRVDANDVVNAGLPSMVRASFSSASDIAHLITLTLGFGYTLVEFDNELTDTNDEYDPTTYTFTAKEDGIYQVNAQIRVNSLITVNTDFGIGIYKNNVLVAEQSFASVVVGVVNVTSPFRSVSTTIDLVAGDTITFKLAASLASVNILGNNSDSYCAIYQIR